VRLLITLPDAVLVDEPVMRVDVDTVAGAWTLLPRHADVATVVVPGLLRFEPEAGGETFVANDHGVLVKAGSDVRVACDRAVLAGALAEASRTLVERFEVQREQEVRARAALARLEADLVRRLGALRRTP